MTDFAHISDILPFLYSSSGDFASASVTFEELGALFEAISGLANNSVVRNLASIGAELASRRRDDYDDLQSKCDALIDRVEKAKPKSAASNPSKVVTRSDTADWRQVENKDSSKEAT
jgi:hypothetical protein